MSEEILASSTSGLTLSVTAIGTVKEEKITRRSGAKENDLLLVVSGDLGGAYCRVCKYLEREKAVFKVNPNNQPDLSTNYAYSIERQLKPEARKGCH